VVECSPSIHRPIPSTGKKQKQANKNNLGSFALELWEVLYVYLSEKPNNRRNKDNSITAEG
jgi:hypothetical protein